MLAGVIEVHDLEGPGKLLVGQIPDPVGAVANEYFLLGAAPAAFDGLPVDARAKLCYPLDGPGIGGRVGVADRLSLVVPPGLGEDAAQFGFASMRRLTLNLALSPSSLFLHHRRTRTVHLNV